MQCDVLIAGAGPAALSAALAALEDGVKVVLVDRKHQVGTPVRCAEFVPRSLAREIEIPAMAIAREIDEMESDFGSTTAVARSPGFLLHRDRWEGFLAHRVRESGGEILLGARILGVAGAGLGIVQRGIRRFVSGEVLIGADGCSSRVRASLGESKPHCVATLQHTYRLPESERHTRKVRIFFRDYIPGGYGWYFPKEDAVHVGVGVEREFCPRLVPPLETLVEELREQGLLPIEQHLARTGGLLPAGSVATTGQDRVLLAGDAAGQTDPISGTGIAPAVLCGRMAGRRAAQAVRQGTVAPLRGYPAEWQAVFGQSLRRGEEKRRWLREDCRAGRPLARLRQCWVVFPEYYH